MILHLRTATTLPGFTIVELLVVIVVIAILAAISIVSYNGITAQAEDARLKTELRSNSTLLALDYTRSGEYPSSLAQANGGKGLTSSTSALDYVTTASGFCLQAVSGRDASVAVHTTESGVINEGTCPQLSLTNELCFFMAGDILSLYYDNEANNAANPACPRDVVIPSVINGMSVASISGAFTSRSITSVVIPSSVTAIHGSAFANNALTDLSIPTSVTMIAASAFTNNALTNLTIPSTLQSIGDSAFANNDLADLTIEYGLETIGVNAFAGNALRDVFVPESVVGIGANAFSGQTAGPLHCQLPANNGFDHTVLGCTTGDYYQ